MREALRRAIGRLITERQINGERMARLRREFAAARVADRVYAGIIAELERVLRESNEGGHDA